MKKKYYSQKDKNNNYIWIYGIHACRAALENHERQIESIYFLNTVGYNKTSLMATIEKREILKKISYVNKSFFNSRLGLEVKHQGVLIKSSKKIIKDFNNLFTSKVKKKSSRFGVILDNISDPQNIGAVFRSARAFNIDFIINTSKNSVLESSSLLNTACGAFETVNLFTCGNISDCIKKFKDNGWWIVGMDHLANKKLQPLLGSVKKNEKILFVLGSEGKGIRRLVKKNCDLLCKIPTVDNKYSLNVSNAAAILFSQLYYLSNEE